MAHSSSRNPLSSARPDRWICPLCSSFASKNPKGIVRHIGRVHSHDANFHICCGLDGCHRTYTKFVSYKKHMYQHHFKSRNSGALLADDNDDDKNYEDDDDDDNSGPSPPTNPHQLDKSKRSTALFLMKLENEFKVSPSALDGIIEDMLLLLEDSTESLRNKLAITLSNKGIEFDVEIASVFKDSSVTNPFQGLHTEYFREKYYCEEMNLLEPLERKLGENELAPGKKIKDFVYEIPFILSLKQFLSDQFILDEVLRGHQRDDDLLGDYCDGSLYKSHSLFSKDSSALEVMIYYDDVEVCNPLGSRAKKHKLAIFYYTLGNISPKYRSTMKAIQLLAITKSNVLQKYGPDAILQSVMSDIGQLESDEGITMELDGVEYNFNGTITLIPGDNLASQYLGGYKSLASALRKCRHCMAVDEEIQSKFVADAFNPRTRETHATHCASLNGPLHDHFSTTYGLNRDSIMNSSRYFHVTEGLVPDIMHDVLEGVLPMEMKELLKHLIQTKVVTLAYVNHLISSFPYSFADATNKPNTIELTTLRSNDHSLKQTATQMWCLGRLLPLMIGNKIGKGSAYWENFLCLLSIVDYCFAPIIHQDWPSYLRVLIDDHHKEFRRLYTNCRLIPKAHYMVHYPEIMCKYGPLVHFWCMRFEGKHNYFKDLAHRVKCFKNIPKTMSARHQQLMCYYRNSSTGSSPYYKETKTSPGFKSVVNSLTYKDELLAKFPSLDDFAEITRLTWVEINGTVYKKGAVIVVDMDLLPHFGIIHDIAVFNTDDFFLVCQVLSTISFEHHLHSFLVSHEHNFCILKQSDIYDHTTLSVYERSNSFYVPLKYQLVENVI